MPDEIKEVLMLDQTIVNWILFSFGAVLSFIVNTIWTAIKDLQAEDKNMTEKLAAVHILVAGDYVKKQEFDKVMVRLFEKLDRIEAGLTKKQDK
tara:strand:- start:9811 stop:10092 length:282 start_codon:yes stop_codon:yes gene_type:complete